MIDANGEPTRWHCAFLIADGKVRWGVPGQVVRITYDEIWVGSCTTPNAGEETTGELEITGGETYFPSHLVIGRNNGNPTTIGGDGIARLTVTVRDGYVNPEKVAERPGRRLRGERRVPHGQPQGRRLQGDDQR